MSYATEEERTWRENLAEFVHQQFNEPAATRAFDLLVDGKPWCEIQKDLVVRTDICLLNHLTVEFGKRPDFQQGAKVARIEGELVCSGDVGRRVTYVDPAPHKLAEYGVISSVVDDRIWVRFTGPGGALCPASKLFWGWLDAPAIARAKTIRPSES